MLHPLGPAVVLPAERGGSLPAHFSPAQAVPGQRSLLLRGAALHALPPLYVALLICRFEYKQWRVDLSTYLMLFVIKLTYFAKWV